MPDRNRDPNRDRIGAGPEFEIAYYTKELGQQVQREMLRKQLALLSESSAAARRGEDPAAEVDTASPPQDRAG
jgi:hypothetical protein